MGVEFCAMGLSLARVVSCNAASARCTFRTAALVAVTIAATIAWYKPCVNGTDLSAPGPFIAAPHSARAASEPTARRVVPRGCVATAKSVAAAAAQRQRSEDMPPVGLAGDRGDRTLTQFAF